MDFTTGLPASPGTPLFPVSPERANRQHYAAPGYSKQAPYGRPVSTLGLSSLSPGGGTTNLALLADSSDSRPTRGSDVQEKVAQFNTLARDAAQRRRDHEAALKRAILGREEAEAENVRLKEELSNLRHERDRVKREETRTRGEKGQAELLAKEAHAQSKTIFEKEVRRARKEAFHSSSAVVKVQDELKRIRQEYAELQRERDDLLGDSDELKRVRQQHQCEQERSRTQYSQIEADMERLRQNCLIKGEQNRNLEHEYMSHRAVRERLEEQEKVLHQKLQTAATENDNLQRDCNSLAQKLAFSEEMREALKKASRADEMAHLAAAGQVVLPPPVDETQPLLAPVEDKPLVACWALDTKKWDTSDKHRMPLFLHPIRGWGPVDKYMENEIAEREEAEERLAIVQQAQVRYPEPVVEAWLKQNMQEARPWKPHYRPVQADIAHMRVHGHGIISSEAVKQRIQAYRARAVSTDQSDAKAPSEDAVISHSHSSDSCPAISIRSARGTDGRSPTQTRPSDEMMHQPPTGNPPTFIPFSADGDDEDENLTCVIPSLPIRPLAARPVRVDSSTIVPLRSREVSDVTHPRTPRILEQRPSRAPRTVSHTSTISVVSVVSDDSSQTPVVDRERALQQIRERRGRARSLAASRSASPTKPNGRPA